MRHGLKRALFFMVLMVVSGNGISQEADSVEMVLNRFKNNGLDFRVGWKDDGEDGYTISLYDSLEEKLQYHVFLPDGRELFSSSRFKKKFEMGCEEDDERIFWELTPDTVYGSLKALGDVYCCLVVGTADKKVFTPPRVEPLSAQCQEACIAALRATDTLLTDSTTIQYLKFHSAGISGDSTRVVVEQQYGLFAVCQRNKNECRVLYADAKFTGENVEVFTGQMDRDGDGLCDVFALDAGDYGGKWLLVYEHGTWHLFQDNGPTPC